MIINQTIHGCHNQTGQSFSGINFSSEHAGREFPCLLHRKHPLVSGKLSSSINYRHGRRDRFFNMVTAKYMTDRGQLTVSPCDGWMTCGIRS